MSTPPSPSFFYGYEQSTPIVLIARHIKGGKLQTARECFKGNAKAWGSPGEGLGPRAPAGEEARGITESHCFAVEMAARHPASPALKASAVHTAAGRRLASAKAPAGFAISFFLCVCD